MTSSGWAAGLPDELYAAREFFWSTGQQCSAAIAEPESAKYGAYAFSVDGTAVRFRIAKTTPTKPGQFVTVWQRSPQGPIRPFDVADQIGFFVIGVHQGPNQGWFVFSQDALVERNIVSRNGIGGKRGFRLYPPWVSVPTGQARRSQSWQLEHFRSADRNSARLPTSVGDALEPLSNRRTLLR
ncbi:MepB family protein [Nocardia jejuensis]|uniref:MepB family protein n=1 Tax=Nocardia jejuensis TaxID=328049 RepID=UPI00083282EE|nr:MepB family protein [Nocardia jejuensis]